MKKLIFFGLLLFNVGCMRPFEPVDLQIIGTNESAFLIPLAGDTTKQIATAGEDFLEKNQVFTKQVKIPQQWVKTGRDFLGLIPNGNWRSAATLIKIDRSPITREWTADPQTGTSSLKEAVWVMTSNQVEFSTGWVCTARIPDEKSAVKFLHNYRNETLKDVLDREVRAMIQTHFGIEVTDLPMHELQKNATPHLKKVVTDVTTFFSNRGLEITNLGITGGFVYKDPKIGEKITEVFNSEQEKTIQIAKTEAQEQANKQVILLAEGKAKALLAEREAEAKGIKIVADAKAYEVEKANSSPIYAKLK